MSKVIWQRSTSPLHTHLCTHNLCILLWVGTSPSKVTFIVRIWTLILYKVLWNPHDLGLCLINGSLAHPSPHPKGHLDWFSYFLKDSCLQCAGRCASKLPLLWESRPPCNTWFLGPTLVHTPRGISVSSAVFVGLTFLCSTRTHTHTDHKTSGTVGHILCCV